MGVGQVREPAGLGAWKPWGSYPRSTLHGVAAPDPWLSGSPAAADMIHVSSTGGHHSIAAVKLTHPNQAETNVKISCELEGLKFGQF